MSANKILIPTSMLIALVFTSASQAASLLKAKADNRIAEHYIIVLKDTRNNALNLQKIRFFQNQINEMPNSEVTGEIASINGFTAKLDKRSLSHLMHDPNVKYIEEDSRIELFEPSYELSQQNNDGFNFINKAPPSEITWGLDRVDQRTLPLDKKYETSTSGKNVNVYVIDSGIFLNEDFGGRVKEGVTFVKDNKTPNYDCVGHGTHVAGTIGSNTYGLAKDVNLYPVRIFGCLDTTTAIVLKGVNWVTQNAVLPAVANMSLGGGTSQALDDAVKASVEKGISYAVAAGNSNTNACLTSPARIGKDSDAITVAASQIRGLKDEKASFSNHGKCIDIFAPGVGIISTLNKIKGSQPMEGTSMASPHVAGAIALYLEAKPEATPKEVKTHLLETATQNLFENLPAYTPNRLLYVGH